MKQLERELNEAKALQNETLAALQQAIDTRVKWRECAQRLAKELDHLSLFPTIGPNEKTREALKRFDELEKGTPTTTAEWMKELREGEAMTVEQARKARICRICHGPDDPPFTYNYGKEYAHTKCLELEKGQQ